VSAAQDASAAAEASADPGKSELRQGIWSAWAALAASGTTLVCCALPALLVALGAGAALSSLVSVFPQIVWLSEHKAAVFGAAVALTAVGGWVQWRNRYAPCPTDPALRAACLRTRAWSRRGWWFSVLLLAIGGWFAFVAPWLAAVD
jgi:hypothetical protein